MKRFYQKFKIYFLIVALICFSLGLGARRTLAATLFNNTNTMGFSATGSVNDSTTMSVTAGGSNLAAFACIAYDNAAGEAVSSVTYGGQPLTSAGAAAHNTSNNPYVEIWYLVNPPTGLNTLAITVSGTAPQDIYYNLVSFKNVNQTTPVRAGTYQAKAALGTTDSMVITSNVNDLTMSCVNTGGAGYGATPTNQTNDGTNTSGGYAGGSDHAKTAAASVTHTWTFAASTNNALAGLSVNGDANVVATTVATSTQGTMTLMGGDMTLMGGTLSK